MMAGAPQASAGEAQPEAPASAPRHIAYTHRYTIEAERANLRAVLEAHLARCKAIDCIVLSQSYTEESDTQSPSAVLNVRVARKDIAQYIDWYNDDRPHSSLNDRTPTEVWLESLLPLKEAA